MDSRTDAETLTYWRLPPHLGLDTGDVAHWVGAVEEIEDGRITIHLKYNRPGHPLAGSTVTYTGPRGDSLWTRCSHRALSMLLSYRVYGHDQPRHDVIEMGKDAARAHP